MPLTIKNITAKNFLSIGNCSQAVNLNRTDLTLVLGENLDLGGNSAGSKNGTGKTGLSQAISYALYGQAISDIKKDNLINRTNSKGMLVTIEFEKDGVAYRVERGRKPAVLSLFKGDVAFEPTDNNAQGDSRETQHEIDTIIGMTHEMYRHIVSLNTYTEPFLSLKSNDQRAIIEQLLGITVLSEKAEKLKELVKVSKDIITSEEFRIESLKSANKKIEEQISSLVLRQSAWEIKHNSELTKLSNSLSELLTLDINEEVANHALVAELTTKGKELLDLETELTRVKKDLVREEKDLARYNLEITNLVDHKCHSCGQEIHNEMQETILLAKQKLQVETSDKVADLTSYINDLNTSISTYNNLPLPPTTYYDKLEGALHHRTTVDHITKQIEDKVLVENPYTDQIQEMRATALLDIDHTVINDTTKLKDHQEFLLKLLTNKDSFIRKRIIDQNLSYLNARLSHYLDKIGLPHNVIFQNDLTVSIEELGRSLDFFNLSRGEMTRVIIALSLSFRDVFESLFGSVNLLFIDELIDNGMDTNGIENAMAILKRMSRDSQKSVWLVSHKDELISRVNNTLHVVKENGFSEWKDVTNG